MNSRSLLLVEDDPTSARLYQTLFERQGCAVTVVADGSDAFMEAHHRPYDIIVLDLMLPSMDGMAMLRRFRAQRRFARTPIFLYTAEDLVRVEALALEAGVTKVFSKTTPAKELVQTIMDTVHATQVSPPMDGDEASELEDPRKPDFRVPKPADVPPPTLRMAEQPKDPPKPPSTVRPRVAEPEAPKEQKGRLSQWFRSKPKDE